MQDCCGPYGSCGDSGGAEPDIAERILAYRMSAEDITSGRMFPFTEFSAQSGSILRGGRAVAFGLLHEGRTYLVEDTYCPNPECRCNEAELVFLEETQSEGKPVLHERFVVALSTIDMKPRFRAFNDCCQDRAAELLRALQQQNQDLAEVVAERYEIVKTLGCLSSPCDADDAVRPTLPNRSVYPSPGRNSPCPCGSGKKYKRCCGSGR